MSAQVTLPGRVVPTFDGTTWNAVVGGTSMPFYMYGATAGVATSAINGALSGGESVFVADAADIVAGYAILSVGTTSAELVTITGVTGTTYTATVTGAHSDGAPIMFLADRSLVNVRWFGAVGDSITDDTGAVSAAVEAAESYGVVLFPSGAYLIDNLTLDGTRGLTLRGVNRGTHTSVRSPIEAGVSAIIQANDIALPLLNITNATTPQSPMGNIRIEHLMLAGGELAPDVIFLNRTTRGTTIDNCFILIHKNALACDGIDIYSSWIVTVSNTFIRHDSEAAYKKQTSILSDVVSSTVVVLNTAFENARQYPKGFVGYTFQLTTGAGSGQTRTVTAWDEVTYELTLDSALSPAPSAGDGYIVGEPFYTGDGWPEDGQAAVHIHNNFDADSFYDGRTPNQLAFINVNTRFCNQSFRLGSRNTVGGRARFIEGTTVMGGTSEYSGSFAVWAGYGVWNALFLNHHIENAGQYAIAGELDSEAGAPSKGGAYYAGFGACNVTVIGGNLHRNSVTTNCHDLYLPGDGSPPLSGSYSFRMEGTRITRPCTSAGTSSIWIKSNDRPAKIRLSGITFLPQFDATGTAIYFDAPTHLLDFEADGIVWTTDPDRQFAAVTNEPFLLKRRRHATGGARAVTTDASWFSAEQHDGMTFSNYGATVARTFTLPAAPVAGAVLTFVKAEPKNLTIKAASGHYLDGMLNGASPGGLRASGASGATETLTVRAMQFGSDWHWIVESQSGTWSRV